MATYRATVTSSCGFLVENLLCETAQIAGKKAVKIAMDEAATSNLIVDWNTFELTELEIWNEDTGWWDEI